MAASAHTIGLVDTRHQLHLHLVLGFFVVLETWHKLHPPPVAPTTATKQQLHDGRESSA